MVSLLTRREQPLGPGPRNARPGGRRTGALCQLGRQEESGQGERAGEQRRDARQPDVGPPNYPPKGATAQSILTPTRAGRTTLRRPSLDGEDATTYNARVLGFTPEGGPIIQFTGGPAAACQQAGRPPQHRPGRHGHRRLQEGDERPRQEGRWQQQQRRAARSRRKLLETMTGRRAWRIDAGSPPPGLPTKTPIQETRAWLSGSDHRLRLFPIRTELQALCDCQAGRSRILNQISWPSTQ